MRRRRAQRNERPSHQYGQYGFVALLIAAVFGATQIGASCTDGVTADCSNPSVCAPTEDGGNVVLPDDAPASLPEAAVVTDTSSPSDASSTADADAADTDGG